MPQSHACPHPEITYHSLHDFPSRAIKAEARQFCLDRIREAYQIEYNPSIHCDLDSLMQEGTLSWYAHEAAGGFFIALDEFCNIVGTSAFYNMIWKEKSLSRLSSRYSTDHSVVQIARVYIRRDFRKKGIGRRLVRITEQYIADHLPYNVIYLHADTCSQAALRFWNNCGYECFNQMTDQSEYGIFHISEFDKFLSV